MSLILEDRPLPNVLRLRLNRPEARNALNLETRRALASSMSKVDADDSIRAVIIAGSGKAFAAGADLRELSGLGPVAIHKLGYHRLWQAVADVRKPVIAAVRGYALGGGCELALHADIVVAGESATFGLPEIKVGIMPGAGGTQRLVRAVGKYRAMRLLMTGEMIKAPVAASWGLVSEVTADDEVEDRAVAVAGTIASGPALALELIKESVLGGADLPLSAGLALERKSLHLLFDTPDQKEGMKAFLEARKPAFE
jgi:enoyl-CoA hydratase/carnithine racemase